MTTTCDASSFVTLPAFHALSLTSAYPFFPGGPGFHCGAARPAGGVWHPGGRERYHACTDRKRLRASADQAGGNSQMPLYEYVCNSCEVTFDKLVRSMTAVEAVMCDRCSSEDVRRVPSRFASVGGLDDPITPMQTSGGCCGGSCGCGH